MEICLPLFPLEDFVMSSSSTLLPPHPIHACSMAAHITLLLSLTESFFADKAGSTQKSVESTEKPGEGQKGLAAVVGLSFLRLSLG